MATTPALDLATYIGTNVGALTLGTNLFVGKVRAKSAQIPSKAVFCLAGGGPAPTAYADGTTTNYRQSAIQVRVRDVPRDFGAGQTLARAVRDAVHQKTIAGYVDVYVEQSEPIYINEDSQGHHEWSINVMMTHEQ